MVQRELERDRGSGAIAREGRRVQAQRLRKVEHVRRQPLQRALETVRAGAAAPRGKIEGEHTEVQRQHVEVVPPHAGVAGDAVQEDERVARTLLEVVRLAARQEDGLALGHNAPIAGVDASVLTIAGRLASRAAAGRLEYPDAQPKPVWR